MGRRSLLHLEKQLAVDRETASVLAKQFPGQQTVAKLGIHMTLILNANLARKHSNWCALSFFK